MNPWRPALLAVLCLALAGCATTKAPIARPGPPLVLETPQDVRTSRGLTVALRLPAGEYRPVFRDKAGTYYRPDGSIIIWGKPVSDAFIFMPDDGGVPALWLEGSLKTDPLTPALLFSSSK